MEATSPKKGNVMRKVLYTAVCCAAAMSLSGCGGSGSGNFGNCVEFNGLEYCSVESNVTGRVWLDRNLGASEVCTDLNDTNCYGDYYQWGRYADGHEKADSNTTTTLAESITDAGSDFITNASVPRDWVALYVDDDGSLRSENWSTSDGSSVCPAGFRVPTKAELEAELFSASNTISNKVDAFESFLKLPSAGSRSADTGDLLDQGNYGGLWTASVNGSDSTVSDDIEYTDTEAHSTSNYRATGQAVRCIQQ
jgi:uncharacterized protein (TIGR02145 family)